MYLFFFISILFWSKNLQLTLNMNSLAILKISIMCLQEYISMNPLAIFLVSTLLIWFVIATRPSSFSNQNLHKKNNKREGEFRRGAKRGLIYVLQYWKGNVWKKYMQILFGITRKIYMPQTLFLFYILLQLPQVFLK